jgi:hypothetical protein
MRARVRRHELALAREKEVLLRWRGVPRKIPKMTIREVDVLPEVPIDVGQDVLEESRTRVGLFLLTSHQPETVKVCGCGTPLGEFEQTAQGRRFRRLSP